MRKLNARREKQTHKTQLPTHYIYERIWIDYKNRNELNY